MEIGIGYPDGRVYTFDSKSREVKTIKKYNLIEPDEIRKKRKVTLVRWIGNESNKMAVFYEDCSMHIISDLIENHLHSDPPTAFNIFSKMRLVEKTRIISEGDDQPIINMIEFPDNIPNLQYYPCRSRDKISDFTSVVNSDYSINPLGIWQFYFKEIKDVKFFTELLTNGYTAFAMICNDNYLRIYDFESNIVVKVIQGYYGYFTCIEFSYDGLLLVTGCINNVIILFETTNFCPIQALVGLQCIPCEIKFDNKFTDLM